MVTKRMTGKDYRKELLEIRKSEKSLIAHIDSRLRELLTLSPDAHVIQGIERKARDIDEYWLSTMSVDFMIEFIESIEEWSAEQQKVIQKKILI